MLDQSNASAVAKEMTPFTEGEDPDVVFESHNHWAVGHIDGFSIRVFRNGKITDAFAKYHELAERLADYPVLDEEDYSQREFDATIENLTDAIWRLQRRIRPPRGLGKDVFDWLSNNNCGAIENVDDQGGYPEEDELKQAFDSLGYQEVTCSKDTH